MAREPLSDAYDVVIVGAGVAGALLAWRLGGAGLKVALLEAGGPVDRGAAVTAYAASASRNLGSPYVAAAAGPEHPGPLAGYYDVAGSPEVYSSTYERVAGGTTWHWLGHTPRLLPNDFRLKSVYGVGVDWPISYAQLEPWYCAAEAALGVAGDDAQWADVHGATRSAPFPMPPIWPSWSDTYVASRVNGHVVQGRPIQVLATPAARNSRPYDGRPPCAGNASCIPICPVGAKYDASVHLRKAVETGHVDPIDNAIVTALLLDEAPTDGARRVRAVRYQRPDKSQREVVGKAVIVCANAIETAKLLLLSASERAPGGVANSSDQVGRNLMDHIQKSVFVRAADPVYPFRGPPSTSGVETFRDGPFRTYRAAMRFSLNNDGWTRFPGAAQPAAAVADAVGRGLFGQALKASVFDAVARQYRFSLSTELLPDPANRVTLSEQVDADGLRRPRIRFAVGDYTHAAFAPALDVVAQMTRLIGGETVLADPTPTVWNGAGHVMGTCRMGARAADAVVDGDCRSFDHGNLFIVGAGLWPTCGTANPTLTVAAIALRAADHIARTEFKAQLVAVTP